LKSTYVYHRGHSANRTRYLSLAFNVLAA